MNRAPNFRFTDPRLSETGSKDPQPHPSIPKIKLVWATILTLSIILTFLSSCHGGEQFFPSSDKNRVGNLHSHGRLMLPPAWTPTPTKQVQNAPTSIDTAKEQISTSIPAIEKAQEDNPIIIGYSVQGRPLEVYRFGNGSRHLMIVAGIHGGYEHNTILLAGELIDFLQNNPSAIPFQVQLHILPSLNPDGATRSLGPLGRGNARGVDLNRNWNAAWKADAQGPGCWDLVPLNAGDHPGSEPETRALMRYLIEADIKGLISYHSAALGIFAGGKADSTISLDLAQTLAAVSDYPHPPIDTGCNYSGTLTDWASEAGIPAVAIELSNHQDTDLEQNLVILAQFLTWKPGD